MQAVSRQSSDSARAHRGTGAAWKAELLAATGAIVEIHAPTGDLSEETRRVSSREEAILHPEALRSAACLKGAVAGVADLDFRGDFKA